MKLAMLVTSGFESENKHTVRRIAEAALLLVHDAVLHDLSRDFRGPVYVCIDDVSARQGDTDYIPVDYDGIVALVFEYDKVITW